MMRAGAMGMMVCGLLALAVPPTATAQQLLFHFPLDGTASVAGSAAGEAKLYLLEEGPAPTTVPGKFGQALYFHGNAAIALPFNLDPVAYPSVTVTAWVKLDPDSRGERTVFSAGNGNVPRLTVYGNRAYFLAARAALMYETAMLWNEWVFVAGTVDIASQRIATYQGEGRLAEEGINVAYVYPSSGYRNPQDDSMPFGPYVFVGSHGFGQWRAKQMAIDEVRVYAGALTPEQIEGVRTATPAAIGETEKNLASGGNSLEAPTLGQPTPDTGLPTAPATLSQSGALVGVGGDTGGDSGGSPSGPAFQDGTLSDESLARLQQVRAESAAPAITYASEEEALAAEERREREAAGAELARQQNELESTRQAETEEEAQLPYYPVGNPAFSAVAGRAGTTSVMHDLETLFMDRIVARVDLMGHACRIHVYATDGAKFVDTDYYRVCEEVGFGGILDVSVDAKIGSIRTCRKDDQDNRYRTNSIQGLRITGSGINADGSTYFMPVTDSIETADCNTWSSQMLCPTNPVHLATGIVVHSAERPSGGAQEIVGLQLICRRIGTR